MKPHLLLLVLILLCSVFSFSPSLRAAQVKEPVQEEHSNLFTALAISDPIEGYNRAIFDFNDFAMVWFFDPLMKGYSFILPKSIRSHVDMAILNLEYFIHLFSCLLQGEGKAAWVETERFFINLTLGVVGIFDVAKSWFNLQAYPEDFGQAFAKWGFGPGFYFVLPVLGPSSFRDAIGLIFFAAFHPITWIPIPGLGVFVFVNRMSLHIGQYMNLRDSSLDKYESMKDLWYLNRQIEIKNLDRADTPYFNNDKWRSN